MVVEAQQVQQLAAATLRRRLFTVDEFEQMASVGILTEDDRVELIDGEIVAMSPLGDRHMSTVYKVDRRFRPHITGDLWPGVQSTARLRGGSKPQPDLMVFRQPDTSGLVVATAANTLIIVEVADTSLNSDRNIKLPLYGRHGIPEAWLFDVINKRMERHTEPGPGEYRQIAIAGRGESLTSTVLPGLTIAVDDILG